jgi:hypothetical protein
MSELSAEDRQRIYEEEKARVEARAAIARPKRRKYLIVGASVAAFIGLLYWLPDLRTEMARQQIQSDDSARRAYIYASAELARNADVVRIGRIQSAEKLGPDHWLFAFTAVYRSDNGLIENGTLSCDTTVSASGSHVEIHRRN